MQQFLKNISADLLGSIQKFLDIAEFWYIADTYFGDDMNMIIWEKHTHFTVYADDKVTMYRVNGKLHRLHSPAVIYKNGERRWYRNGLLHRDDGPAITFAHGNKAWYRNGKLHRSGYPAVIYQFSQDEWYIDGILQIPEY